MSDESTNNAEQWLESPQGRFLTALFHQDDLVSIRPIETWTENGRKHSRVVYRHCCVVPTRAVRRAFARLYKVCSDEKANFFFGVCPRVGGNGRFELAWQIRVVRALWTDIDGVTVEQARERIGKAGLPAPSIIVMSGSGVHLYWLLSEPFLIDDADDPPPVETEWAQTPGGRKKPRKYFVEDGDKVYLEQRRRLSRLSDKAQAVQGLLAGIAKGCGGDHTTDLSRLLRMPGTPNRKDERNGRLPVEAVLIECDSTRRYPIAAFDAFKIPSSEGEVERLIAQMPLPKRRKLTAAREDKLNELISACAIAETGHRSEPDFAVCCYSIRSGVPKEELWAQVTDVGKFKEQGRRYFEVTWENAEYEVRATTFEKVSQGTQSKKRSASDTPTGRSEVPFSPSGAPHQNDDEHATITVNPKCTPVFETMSAITDALLKSGTCFNRADQLVVVRNNSITPILSAPELAGLLNNHVEFYFVEMTGGEFKPIPATYSNTWLNHPGERARFPLVKLYTQNPVYGNDWQLVLPGFNPESGIYYAGPAIPRRHGTEHLDALLRDFCFKAVADRTNYLGMLLTTMLVPRFIGSKPAVLFNGNQPELGKSILAQILAIFRDGKQVQTATYNPNDEEFEKRLGAIVRRGVTTVIIDNAKARGRNPQIDSACLERSITDTTLSFRLLGYSEEIRAENSHIFCITANSPDVDRDLVTRSVVVNLYYEGNPQHRTFSIADPETYAEEHRVELLGELIGMVERWKENGMPLAKADSRFNKKGWANIVGGILSVNGEPDFLGNAEEAAHQLDETRREFAELVAILADHAQGAWTAAELAELAVNHKVLESDLGSGSSRSQSTRMGILAGRYVAERFELPGGRTATFHRAEDRKGNLYRVGISE